MMHEILIFNWGDIKRKIRCNRSNFYCIIMKIYDVGLTNYSLLFLIGLL